MLELTTADVHALLLGLAGRAPDAWLAVTRASLAAGDHGHVVRMLTALAGSGLAFTEAEAALVSALDAEARPRTAGEPATGHRFECGPDPAVLTADLPDSVVALWRAVRGDGTVVHLAEAAPDADLAVVAGELQQLVGNPVEVFSADADLPPYHEAALAEAVLVAVAPAPVRVARVFDGADPRQGPFFVTDRERVDGRRRELLLDYLRGGEPVLEVDGALDDVLEPGVLVAAGFRSDGDWVWNDATVHYLDRHGVAPDPDLAAHVADRGAAPAELARSVRARVRSLLTAGPRDADLATAWFAS